MSARGRTGCLVWLARLTFLAGLAVAGLWWWQHTQDLAALERRRDELRERLTRAHAADPRLREAPPGDVLIGMPVAFTSALAGELARGLLDQVQIELRDIRIRAKGTIRTKLLLGSVDAGRYAVEVNLHEARALIEPATPRVEFHGKRLAISLPATVARGHGRATVKLDWHSLGLGKLVCEDFSLTQSVAASVVPRSYQIKGAFLLAVEDGALVATPDFPDILVRVGVKPDAAAWKAVDEAIEKRSWKCEAVLRKVEVPRLLAELLARGFEVRIPEKVFKPARLPAAVTRSMSFDGKSYLLDAQFLEVRLTSEVLWYGANVAVRAVVPESAGEAPVSPAPAGPAPPEPSAAGSAAGTASR